MQNFALTCLPAGRGGGSNPNDLPNNENTWYTYVLLCENGSFYKGFTKNLKASYKRHLTGDGAQYTKKHKPIAVVYYETFPTEKEAIEREEKGILSQELVGNG